MGLPPEDDALLAIYQSYPLEVWGFECHYQATEQISFDAAHAVPASPEDGFAKGANWVSITQACVEYVVSQKPFVLKDSIILSALMSSSCRLWYGIIPISGPPCTQKR